jgi:hypothetical protein
MYKDYINATGCLNTILPLHLELSSGFLFCAIFDYCIIRAYSSIFEDNMEDFIWLQIVLSHNLENSAFTLLLYRS